MKPAPFQYARARSGAEAVDLLAEHGAHARLLAGGQSLLPLLCRRLERPRFIIDINHLASLDRIELLPTQVCMGALVRQEQARRSAIVREYAAGVAEALAWVANPVVRTRGTVVGNLVTNSPGAELPAVALALGAEFVVRLPGTVETLPAAAVLGANKRLPAGALVTHVLWPRRTGRAGFYEVSRRDGHAPVVSAMVSEGENRDDWRVALSGVCATGLSCATMAGVIAAQFPRSPSLRELAAALHADLSAPPYGDLHSSARYRREVAPVISRRALQLLAGRATAQ